MTFCLSLQLFACKTNFFLEFYNFFVLNLLLFIIFYVIILKPYQKVRVFFTISCVNLWKKTMWPPWLHLFLWPSLCHFLPLFPWLFTYNVWWWHIPQIGVGLGVFFFFLPSDLFFLSVRRLRFPEQLIKHLNWKRWIMRNLWQPCARDQLSTKRR